MQSQAYPHACTWRTDHGTKDMVHRDTCGQWPCCGTKFKLCYFMSYTKRSLNALSTSNKNFILRCRDGKRTETRNV